MIRSLLKLKPQQTYCHRSIIDRLISDNTNGNSDTVIVEKIGPVTTIAINRPEVRNCVNPSTAKLLFKSFKEFEDDDEAKVAVLYGKGGNFCAGADLKAVAGPEISEYNLDSPQNSDEGPMGPSRMLLKKPLIGAISGYAVAGGLELALLCDLRVVEDSAVMGVFCRRFGVPLIDGGTVRLPQLIGLSRALDMILTGRSINATEAKEFGLANRIVGRGTSLGEAFKLAETIAKFPQRCMNVDRRSAYYSCYGAKSHEDALTYEWENGVEVIQDESVKGAKKFTEGIGKHGSFNLNRPSKL